MSATKKENQHKGNTSPAEASGQRGLSRRDILKIATATLTGAIVAPVASGCDQYQPPPTATPTQTSTQTHTPSPTNTPRPTNTPKPTLTSTPDAPQTEVELEGTEILGFPGDYDDVVTAIGVGTLVYVIAKDATGGWYQVRTEDGKEGWVEVDRLKVTPALSSRINTIPQRFDIEPLGTPKAPLNPAPVTTHYWYPN